MGGGGTLAARISHFRRCKIGLKFVDIAVRIDFQEYVLAKKNPLGFNSLFLCDIAQKFQPLGVSGTMVSPFREYFSPMDN